MPALWHGRPFFTYHSTPVRALVTLLLAVASTTIPANAIEYLNRLGDLLFVLARVANRQAGVADDPWIHP